MRAVEADEIWPLVSPKDQAVIRSVSARSLWIGALDPLTRELIYIAVSAANGCPYCIHSHTAAAKQKGMTDAQHMHLLSRTSSGGSSAMREP